MTRITTVALIALALLAGESYARGSSGTGGFRGGRAPRGVSRTARSRTAGRSPFGRMRSTRPAPTSRTARTSRAAQPTQRARGSQVPRGTRTNAPTYRTRPGTSATTRDRTGVQRTSRSGLFTSRANSRSGGMSTAEYLQRRYRTTGTRGSPAGRTARGQDARIGSTRSGDSLRRGSRHDAAGTRHASSGRTTGYRQPTIGPGYADRFPGTGGPPIRGDCRYYRPCYSRYRNCWWGFYYAWPVAYAYVPFGFYGSGTSIYIDTAGTVADEYRVERYEESATEPEAETEIQAAAGSAAAERYMREATELFRARDYPEAARRFRLAAIAAPDTAGPLFAMGQALIVLENYPYAAKVIREAIDLQPSLLKEGGDLGSVYSDREEFGRMQATLAKRIADRPDDLHALFLLGVTQYYSGDPAARATFGKLSVSAPDDSIAARFVAAANERFRKADELPEIH